MAQWLLSLQNCSITETKLANKVSMLHLDLLPIIDILNVPYLECPLMGIPFVLEYPLFRVSFIWSFVFCIGGSVICTHVHINTFARVHTYMQAVSTLPPSPLEDLSLPPSSSSKLRKTKQAHQSPTSPTPSPTTPALESCEACGLPVPLTNLEKGECPNGHVWSRCGLTLCLATDARCSSCIQCGTIVNNALTLSTEDSEWRGVVF